MEKKPVGALFVVTVLAIVILALWFGVYFITIGRA